MGLSLRQVEHRTGVSRGTLSKIERGRELPDAATLLSLADVYGIPPEQWSLHVEWRTRAELVEPAS